MFTLGEDVIGPNLYLTFTLVPFENTWGTEAMEFTYVEEAAPPAAT